MKKQIFLALAALVTSTTAFADVTSKQASGSSTAATENHNNVYSVTSCQNDASRGDGYAMINVSLYFDNAPNGNPHGRFYISLDPSRLPLKEGETYKSKNSDGKQKISYRNGVLTVVQTDSVSDDSWGLSSFLRNTTLQIQVDPELKNVQSIRIQAKEWHSPLLAPGLSKLLSRRLMTDATCVF